MGLLTASKVSKRFLTKDDQADFKFPIGLLSSSDSYEDIEVTLPFSQGLATELNRGKIHNLATASDLQAFLSTTTYAIVTFWTDYDGTQKKIGLEFVKLARELLSPASSSS